MPKRPLIAALAAVLLLAGGLLPLWVFEGREDDSAEGRAGRPRSMAEPAETPTGGARAEALTRLAAEIPAEQVSPIASELNAPRGTIQRDLEIVAAVLEAWRTNFPREGNPVGENHEITQALAGDNSLQFAFLSPRHPAINDRGELCDRWGTPFRFHQLSGSVMELISAGPDRRFATDDDVRR